jgi:hypothetical protein
VAESRDTAKFSSNRNWNHAMSTTGREQPFSLGIVLVHGIGEHQQGETLLQFGEPLLECLHARVLALWQQAETTFAPAKFDDATAAFFEHVKLGTKLPIYVREATPAPLRRLDRRNAFAEIRVSVPERVTTTTNGVAHSMIRRRIVDWKIVETWWGEQVIEPNAARVIGWMITRAPWVVAQFFYERDRFASERGPSAGSLRKIGYPVQAWLFAVSVQIGLVLFAIAGLVPVLNKWVGPALLKIAGILGDAYVLIVQDMQHAAIIGRLRQTLKSLADECGTMIVIPHSQGSGVVFDTLTSADHGGEPWVPNHLITFGSGVAKLKTLFYAESREAWSFQAAGWIPAFSTLAAVGGTWLSVEFLRFPLVAAMMLGLVVGAGFAYLAFAVFLKPTFDRCLQTFRAKARKSIGTKGSSWTDFSATHDPVPMGSLDWAAAHPRTQDEALTRPRVLGFETVGVTVTNERSWTSDHVTYVHNKLDVCLPIADKLLSWSGLITPVVKDDEAAQTAEKWYDRLAEIRGLMEGVGCYLLLAAIPVFSPAQPWKESVWFKWIAIRLFDEKDGWLAIAIPKASRLTEWPVVLVGIAIAILLYGFLLVNLSHFQQWWRNEIAIQRIREAPMNETTMRLGVVGLFSLYLTAFMSVGAIFLIEGWKGWLCVAAALVFSGALLTIAKARHITALDQARAPLHERALQAVLAQENLKRDSVEKGQ